VAEFPFDLQLRAKERRAELRNQFLSSLALAAKSSPEVTMEPFRMSGVMDVLVEAGGVVVAEGFKFFLSRQNDDVLFG
jgi:hypothetical protein